VVLRLGNRDVNIAESISGGRLGGVLDFRRNMLDDAMNDLGMTLNGLVASSNWQHYQGYDLNGNVGREIFSELEANVMADRDNVRDGTSIRVSFNPLDSGVANKPPYDPVEPATYAEKNGQLQTAFDAIGQFKAQNYEIRVVEGEYEFFGQPSGERITPKVDPGNPNIFQIDGLQFDLSGHTKIDGDRFMVKPHRDILDQLEKNITNAEDLATRGQSAIPSFPDLKDRLGVTTNDLDNTDPANTINGVTLEDRFDQLFGAGSFATVDDDGDNIIDRDEYEGVVGPGIDTTAVPKPAGEGDNTNIANLASFQSKKLLFSDERGEASESLLGGYSAMSANVGMYVRGTEIQMTAQENTFDQIEKRRESMSGVNLDEEAANLMKYQQAYQASAQIIQTSQTLFQSLLGAVRL
jgi:flagellar hook-associated protein 1 FlgK